MFKLFALFAIVAMASAQQWSQPIRDGECRPVDPVNGDMQLLVGPSCDRYRACNSGFSVVKPCPPGLHFNMAKQTCDWPEQAGCNGRRRWFAESEK